MGDRNTYNIQPDKVYFKNTKLSKTKKHKMEKFKLLSLIVIMTIISLNFQSCFSPNSQEETKVETTDPKVEEVVKETNTSNNNIDTKKEQNTSGLSDIDFIREKYAIISGATNYKVDSITVECEQGISKIERRSTDKGELRYLLEENCGDHGCVTTHHFFWDNKLIFIFRQNYYYAGNKDYMNEHRIYFKNNKMIRCLEKDISTDKGYEALKELTKKTSNKTVDCTPAKRTRNLQQLMNLDINKAKEFYCN